MKRIRSLMGRRQFLIGAAASSALGLISTQPANASGAGSLSGASTASGEPGGIAGEKRPADSYPHLLSPLKVGNVVLKNRMYYTQSVPHFLQGPEAYPSDAIRSYYANIARSAAIVTCRISGAGGRPREERTGDSAHMTIYDLENPAVQNYIDQMVEGVHCWGSLATVSLGTGQSAGVDLSADNSEKMIGEIVSQAKWFQDRGIDMGLLGGDGWQNNNRARFGLELMQAVRKACGQDFVLCMSITVINPAIPPETSDSFVYGHYTLADAISAAKMFEDTVDILYFRASSGMANHPIGVNQERNAEPLVLDIARAIKESGTKMILAPNGGFRDPETNDEYIANGKTDMVSMARSFICDPEYGRKAYEGRGEDIVPCIMCNKCHGLSMRGPWYSVCSVNPTLGIGSVARLIAPPTKTKRVAVIGGGPAGMRAAVTAAERGHQVTIYEKDGALGGLLWHSDVSQFKWPLKDYKDYLVRQTYKAGVEVLLGTAATPDMIRSKGYDAVLAAVGAEPAVPRIPGFDGDNVWNIVSVYENEKSLGKKVAFIGGGEYGVETALYLAGCGHAVTVLTSGGELIPLDRVHYPEILIETYEHMDNFSYILGATPTGISKGHVTYTDAKGGEKSIQAYSVVVYNGLKAKQDEALMFSGTAQNEFFTIGDCTGRGGDVQKSTRSAFFAASQL